MLESRARWLIFLIALILVLFALTFDALIPNISRSLPGDADSASFVLWHVWWPAYSFTQPDGPVIQAYNSAPYLSNHLAYAPILQSLIFGALRLITPTMFALNVLLILSFGLTWGGTLTFLTGQAVPLRLAVLGATAFVLTGWYYGVLSKGDLILAGLWLMPIALVVWERWLRRPDIARSIMVVAVIYVAVLTGVQHFAWIIGLWLPYALVTMRSHLNQAGEVGNAVWRNLPLTIIGLLILLAIYPMPGLVRSIQGFAPAFASMTDLTESAGLTDIILLISPALWFLLILTLFFTVPHRESYFWLIMGAVTFIWASGLMLDPVRLLMAAFRLPAGALYNQSIFFGMSSFAVVVFCALNWKLAEAIPHQRLMTIFVGIVIIGSSTALRQQFPTQALEVDPFYLSITDEPEDYLLLEYPFGVKSISDARVLGDGSHLSVYAVWHQKRTLSGIAPYYPDEVFSAFESRRFLFPESLVSGDLDEVAGELAEAIRTWRIGYVVIHSDRLDASALNSAQSLLEASGEICVPNQSGRLIIYRARWHPKGCE